MRALEFSFCDFYGETCRSEELKEVLWTFVGSETMCFEFNPYNASKLLSIGKVKNYYSGFNILFDVGENMLYGSFGYRGVVIYITPYGDDHRYNAASRPIDAKGGEATVIKLTEKQVSSFSFVCVSFRVLRG